MKRKIAVRLWLLVIAGFAAYGILPSGTAVPVHERPQVVTVCATSLCGWTPPHVQRYMPWTTA